jgi:hypothetical protein
MQRGRIDTRLDGVPVDHCRITEVLTEDEVHFEEALCNCWNALD